MTTRTGILALAATIAMATGFVLHAAPDLPAPTPIPIPGLAVAEPGQPPRPVVVLTPESFEAMALKWIAVVGTVLSALVTMLAILWTKVTELRHRADRQALKTGSLQEQATANARLLPAPPLLMPAPAPPETPGQPGGGPTAVNCGPAIALLVSSLLVLSGCDTTRPTNGPDQATNVANAGKNARGAAANQALREAGKFLGAAGTQALYATAVDEMTGKKVDFGHSAAAAVWAQVDYQTIAGGIGHIVSEYSAHKLPNTAQASQLAMEKAVSNGVPPDEAAGAIAAVISTAAGAPPKS